MPASGHLRIPNDLVEILSRLRLNGTQWQILWAVWRRTLCWQQPGEWGNRTYPIGISDVVDATGLNESQVKREMAELVDFNIILRDKSPDGLKPSPGGRGRKPMTSFNLDISTWNVRTKGSALATLNEGNGSESATLFKARETVAEKQPISIQKGSALATLSDSGKDSELATLNEGNGSELAPKTVAEERPFNDKRATLSPNKVKLGKKHLKKPKETKDGKKKPPSEKRCSDQATELAHLLKTLIVRNNPRAKTPEDITKWAIDFDRMLNIDQRTPEEIKVVLEFSQNDSFWCANILGAAKLREKFDQLYLKHKEKEKRSAEEKGKGGSYGRGKTPAEGGADAHRPGSEGEPKFPFKAIKSGGTPEPDDGDQE